MTTRSTTSALAWMVTTGLLTACPATDPITGGTTGTGTTGTTATTSTSFPHPGPCIVDMDRSDDGTLDQSIEYTYDAAGQVVQIHIDWDADGKISVSEWNAMMKDMQMDAAADDYDDDDERDEQRPAHKTAAQR